MTPLLSLSSSLLVALLSCSSLASRGQAVTTAEWAQAINVAGRQRMLSQRMSKEFLLVAKGINVSHSKTHMAATIALFNDSLTALTNGDGSMTIPAPPNSNISDQLSVVSGLWDTFKMLLESNVDSDPIPAGVLTDVADQSLPLLAAANEVVTLYVAAATTAGATVPGTTVNIAGRQRMLSQKMTKEALLVALDVDAAANKVNLAATIALFQSSHMGLLDGDSNAGLTATTDACILQQMQKVSDLWLMFEPLLSPIAAGTMATDADLQQIADMSPVVLTTMNVAVGLYASANPTCANTFSATEWSTAINVAGRQRMLSQKMSKEFLLVAKGIDSVTNTQNMASTIALFEGSLKNLIQGSTADSLPAAPTQSIADQLLVVKGLWVTFKALLEGNVNADPINTSVLENVASQSLPLLTQANAAVSLYVAAATSAGAAVPGATVNIAGRQRMLSQKMSKEALLVALGVEASTNKDNLNTTMGLFATSQRDLVHGSGELPETTNECILAQMRVVDGIWAELQGKLDMVRDGGQITDAMLQDVADLNPTLLTESNNAVTLYVEGNPTGCPTSTTTATNVRGDADGAAPAASALLAAIVAAVVSTSTALCAHAR